MLIVVFAIFVICFVLERLFAGWRLPRVRSWPLRVVGLNVVQLGVVILAGWSWEIWFAR